jgi:hypothetical protein
MLMVGPAFQWGFFFVPAVKKVSIFATSNETL